MIGILAGMGPKSTAPFVDLVVAQCQEILGAHHDIDFPPMMIYALPTPFYIDRPIDHDALKRTVMRGLQKLESTGVWFIAMPCNTAHAYFDALAASISVPLLNIVRETIAVMPPGIKRLALLATQTTIDSGIYQQDLTRAGYEMVHHPATQSQVNGLILAIKNGQPVPDLVEQWQTLLHQLELAEIDAAIVACTDLNAVSDRTQTTLPLIDSALALAQATVVAYARQSKP